MTRNMRTSWLLQPWRWLYCPLSSLVQRRLLHPILAQTNLYGRTLPRFAPRLVRLLGWQVGISSSVFGPLSFSEAAGLADALGLASIEGDSRQKVSPQIDKNLDYNSRLTG